MLLLPDSRGEGVGGLYSVNYVGVIVIGDIIGDIAVRETFAESFLMVLFFPTSTLSLPVIVLLSP